MPLYPTVDKACYAYGMGKKRSVYLPGSKKSQVILAIILICSLACVGAVSWWVYRNTEVKQPIIETPEQITNPAPVVEKVVEEPAVFDTEKLQVAIDDWSSGLDSEDSASVVLMDEDSNVVASYNPDQEYFTASIYKLFVAYEGYRAVDNGQFELNETYLGGSTRAECLDLMIRESDSPCAEKMWNELGKEEITDKIIDYGIKNTSLVGLSTTALDSALITSRIMRGEGLSEPSKLAFHESMKTQIFRDTLNKGFSTDITVYNKIGFNQQVEYHDVGFIELQDGRRLVVSVLTSGVGTKKIVELATELEQVL